MIDALRCNGGDFLEIYPGRRYTWDEAYWRTLIANGMPGPAPATYGDHFKVWRRSLESVTAGRALEPRIPFDEEVSNVDLIASLVSQVTKSSSFFTTEHGYFGLGPSPRWGIFSIGPVRLSAGQGSTPTSVGIHCGPLERTAAAFFGSKRPEANVAWMSR